MARALAVVAALAVASLVGLGAWLYLSLDWIVKHAIESYGSDILEAAVEVDEVRVSPVDGAGKIRGLRIGNPKGFRTPSAATVTNVELSLDPSTAASGVVLVRRIVVVGPSITYEPGNAGANFDALQRNVAKYMGAEKGKQSTPRKLIVESLTIRNARLTYAPQVGRGTATISFSLPDIQLKDVGKKRGGVTVGELAKIILDALVARIADAMGRAALQRSLGNVLGR